jgi:hypothetical protein
MPDRRLETADVVGVSNETAERSGDRRLEIHTAVAQYITLHEDGTYTMDTDALYETECPWPFYEEHAVYEPEPEGGAGKTAVFDYWASYDDVPADAWNELSLRIRAAFTKEAQTNDGAARNAERTEEEATP